MCIYKYTNTNIDIILLLDVMQYKFISRNICITVYILGIANKKLEYLHFTITLNFV